MFFRVTTLLLLPCLLLASCAQHVAPPVPSAELQAAFQGPLCTRLDGVEWPCSDTDGRLWKEWYAQRAAAEQAAAEQASRPTVWQVAGAVLLVGTLGVLVAATQRSSRYSHYNYSHYNTVATRCSYGQYSSTCTTRY